mmetsp:Transcript_28030/g.71900  ORF Transcript_28030/g.71900 Transcript_28030/m.71900 type:complete len:1184 (+) Transcript_28030:552-4103(+)
MTGVFVRRAEFDDHSSILALVGEEAHLFNKRYGTFDVTSMIENASLGVSAVDEKGTLIGYAAFFDFPALTPAVTPSAWPDWLHSHFGHDDYSASNTMFLSFFLADHLNENEVAENILRTAFTTLPDVDVILFVLASDVRLFPPLRDTFEPLQCLLPDATDLRVFACPRGLYLPTLLIREARVEDHDDLVPVFNSQSEVLTERFGEFFIAELIETQNASNRALVAEVDGHAIGLMSISSEIDLGLLQQCFDLRPFNLLMRVDEEAATGTSNEPLAVCANAEKVCQGVEAAVAAEETAGIAVDDSASTEVASKAEIAELQPTLDMVDQEDAETIALMPEMMTQTPIAESPPMHSPPMLCNAFCVAVFCMDESFESRSADFLHAAFALYPEREYAIITLPHTTPEFSLLNSFSQVEPVPSSSLGHILYVFHRDALGGALSLAVRPADVTDLPAIAHLVAPTQQNHSITELVEEATGPPPEDRPRKYSAYIAECSGQLVSLTLLDHDCVVQDLQSQYSLEDFILFTEHKLEHHVMLRSFVVNPIFAKHSRFILKEIFRQQQSSCMYFKLRPDSVIPPVLSEFVQVRPRRRPVCSPELDMELAEQSIQLGKPPRHAPEADGALYFLTRKLISEPKIVSNARIVVLGCSDAAIALLEALTTVPYLTFNYLYLVGPRARERLVMPRGTVGGSHALSFFSRSCAYTTEELVALGLGARVRLVDSRVVDIDRQSKYVMLPDDSILPYDYLIIAPEFADQSLQPLGPDAVGVTGAFSIIDEEAEAAATAYLAAQHASVPVIVYGATLDAYCTLQGLLSRGVAPSVITLVQPPVTEGEDCFYDPRVLMKVQRTLHGLGIQVKHGLRLVGLDSDDSRLLTAAIFEESVSGSATVTALQCSVLLCCGRKSIERATFEAINSNSLVYDGRLVVDHNFRTNDPVVYASGIITKFARRYRSKTRMELCSSREAGARLAQALLPVLDPLSSALPSTESAPRMEKPRIEGAFLPGGFQYLHIIAPSPACDSYTSIISHPAFGRELVSEPGAGSDINYTFCAVRLDRHGIIHSIVYLGNQVVEEQNWMCLIGVPETALNNLASRFDENIIPDLVGFLQQNWAIALYHDRFNEFRIAMRQELEGDEDFRKALSAAHGPSNAQEELDVAAFLSALPSSKCDVVRTRLRDFIHTNKNQLDMYQPF